VVLVATLMAQTNNSKTSGPWTYDAASKNLSVPPGSSIEVGATVPGTAPAGSVSISGKYYGDGSGLSGVLGSGAQGPKGDTGATGSQGPIGATGPQGPKGDTGVPGPQGPQGSAGATGPQGSTGAAGPQGPKGDTGLPGPQGLPGLTGATGPQGTTGAVGPQGLKGDPGALGTQGPPGATGPQGPKGDTGATGATGPQGTTGPQGIAGPPNGFVDDGSTISTMAGRNLVVGATVPGGAPAGSVSISGKYYGDGSGLTGISGTGVLTASTNSADPTGTCSPVLSSTAMKTYYATGSQSLWFCDASGAWQKIISSTNTGSTVWVYSTGTAPATPGAGTIACYASSTSNKQVCVDSSGNAATMVLGKTSRDASRFVTNVDANGIQQTEAITASDLPGGSASTTVNGQICSLGGSCTISAGSTVAGAPYVQSFTAQTSVALTHNLGLNPITAFNAQCFDASSTEVFPFIKKATDLNTVTVTFLTPQTGSCTVTTGGTGGGGGSGNTISPSNNTDNFVPQWNGANSKTLKDGLAVAQAATASTIAERNSLGEVIAANTVATGKTPMATDTAMQASQLAASVIPATPLATGTSVTLAGPRQYYVCTGTCTVTPPVPAAGYEFCVLNGDNVTTVITMAAIGSSARYEATARTSYGTAGTGTLVSGGGAGDKVCIVGLDATHYLTLSSSGTWTAN
jgi:hypothetical protein